MFNGCIIVDRHGRCASVASGLERIAEVLFSGALAEISQKLPVFSSGFAKVSHVRRFPAGTAVRDRSDVPANAR